MESDCFYTYLILAVQASNFYHGFYNVLDIFITKIKTLSSDKFSLTIEKCDLFLERLETLTASKG